MVTRKENNMDLKNKVIEKTEDNNSYIKIYFTDKTILEVFAVNRLHSGVGLESRIISIGNGD